jgi:hypothetical protein
VETALIMIAGLPGHQATTVKQTKSYAVQLLCIKPSHKPWWWGYLL